jgi:hypothetical protein
MAKFFIFILIVTIYYIPVLGNQLDQTKEDSVATQAFSGTSNIWLKNGNLYRGYGFSVKQDSIILFTMIGKQRFNKNQITKIRIEPEQKTYKNGFAGLYLGVLLGNIIFYTEDDNSPTAYLDTETGYLGYWLLNIIFAGVGAGAGYLIDLATDKSYEFDLLANIRDWETLKNFHSRKMDSPGRWHFAVQSAWVYPRIKSFYEKPLKQHGYSFHEHYYYGDSKFNLLRKIQLTYSLDHNFEIGAAVFWQGERAWSAYNYENYNSSNLEFSNEVTGYYAVGVYNLLSLQSTKLINLKLGLALGFANVNFKIDHYGYYYGSNDFSHKIDKALYSQIVFAELLFKPFHGISLGLTADYSETPAQTIPEILLTGSEQTIPPIPETSIKSKKISFGNSSVGFLMRLNF